MRVLVDAPLLVPLPARSSRGEEASLMQPWGVRYMTASRWRICECRVDLLPFFYAGSNKTSI